jgi:two-component system, chemotaxis family, sensor kinase CheA
VLAEEDVLPRPLAAPLKRVRNVASLATLASGEICPVLNPADLLRSAVRVAPRFARPAPRSRRSILLVEDSALVRAMEKRVIEDAGYDVVTAVDGEDAIGKLGSRPFAGVVSDVQMPHLDGLGLTARIREDARYRDLPVILVTALASDADKRRGLEVGANAYIPKPAFDQQLLLVTLKRLVGA